MARIRFMGNWNKNNHSELYELKKSELEERRRMLEIAASYMMRARSTFRCGRWSEALTKGAIRAFVQASQAPGSFFFFFFFFFTEVRFCEEPFFYEFPGGFRTDAEATLMPIRDVKSIWE
uniref:Uncharacterized protein n=1 Tax=Candidozyma auris TaxID=498019 RepID=A0A0L0NYR1_CANAR